MFNKMVDDDFLDFLFILLLLVFFSDDEFGFELIKEKGILKFFYKIDCSFVLEFKEKILF